MKKELKTVILIISLFLACFCVFGEDSPKVFFPSKASTPQYPMDKDLGLIVDANSSVNHAIISKALQEAYSFDWSETYIAEKSKKMLTSLFSPILSELLPSSSFLLSKAYTNADNSTTISVKFVEPETILTFILEDNKIINISSLKK